MTTRRRSALDDGSGRRRRRRYSKQINWTGILVFIVVFGILVIVAVVLAERMGENNLDPTRGSATDAEPARTTPDPDGPVETPEVTPGRPAPELEGTAIIQADALFKRVRTLFTQAQRADADGDAAAYKKLLSECRAGFVDLDAYLKIYTDWLADAKAGRWRIPKTYETLRRRIERYGKLRTRLSEFAR